MTRARVALACALLGVAEAALAQEPPPPVQQVQMTCRMAKNVPSGTKVHVAMRAKYTHFQDSKADRSEAVEVWAMETLVWEEEVPASGGVQAKHFVFTFDQAFPPPLPGQSDGIVFVTEWKAVHVAPVNGSKAESGEISFAMPKPAKPSDWVRSLTVRKDRNGEGGLALALYPPSGMEPGAGIAPGPHP